MVRRGKATIYRDLFAVADGFARRGKPKTSAAEVFFCSSDRLTNSTRETMDAAAGGAFLLLTIPAATALVEKMASNQGWNEECVQTCKRG